jgi:hypothetical protein
MLKTKSNALQVAETTLGKVTGVSKPVSKFIIHTVELWLGMNCRYVFSYIGRWGSMTEKIYCNGFKKIFDWFGFNFQIVKQHCSKKIIPLFDPSCIKKNGKQTYGLGMFCIGVRQRALKGLEISCLAFVDGTPLTSPSFPNQYDLGTAVLINTDDIVYNALIMVGIIISPYSIFSIIYLVLFISANPPTVNPINFAPSGD